MSYDLYLFRPPAGRDPAEYFEERQEQDDFAEGDGSSDPAMRSFSVELQTGLGELASCYCSDDMIEVCVSYALSSAQFDGVNKKLHRYLERAWNEIGLAVYDPQEGRVLDPNSDLGFMRRDQARGAEMVRDITASMPSNPKPAETRAPKRPWWKFW